ncbi:cysteine hydrolase family protein [Rhodovibrionaceae bacterium A322]
MTAGLVAAGIPDRVIQKIAKRRGGQPYAFPSLIPAQTALVVIDLQASQMTGLPGDEPLERYASRLNSLARALRQSGGEVVWVSSLYDQVSDFPASHPPILGADLPKIAQQLQRGSRGARLWAALDKQPGDWQSEKQGYSAFWGTDNSLVQRLHKGGFQSLLLAGQLTNICVESSARDAFQQGFQVTLLSDGCKARSLFEHQATLYTHFRNFGDVRSCAEAQALL